MDQEMMDHLNETAWATPNWAGTAVTDPTIYMLGIQMFGIHLM